MKTGSGDFDTSAIENAAIDVFLPVLESATVLAGHYTKACGRNCVTAQDMSYGLMYAARNVAGKHIGSLYPEVYGAEDSDAESEPDSSDWETDSDPGEPESESASESVSDSDAPEDAWTRYEGTEDETALKMNECADTWNAWTPENPTERALKNAVDKNSFFGKE
jgi:hypothetical protein